MLVKRKRNVYLSQVNFQYGNNVFVPYSIGTIIAYCKTILEIDNNFEFQPPKFLRENFTDIVKGMDKPFIAGFSCYLWNWEYNKLLAKAVKEAYPDTLIVFGGNHVPNASAGFFIEHPYVDILVHGEGEISFSEILLESLSAKPDYSKIPGISIKISGNQTLKTPPREKMEDLSVLPSPYLSGVFDFMLGGSFLLSASQETNRGCPYRCKFCDWGNSASKKLALIEESRIIEEFEWFGRNRIEYLFNCDANYGIFPRDYNLTEKMIEIRNKHGGYPGKFRMCTAKNSNEKIFAIAKILNDAGMNKGATLSFQSMDDHTLRIVKRENIKIEKFSVLMEEYRKAGISTYTELILGMPGETYESTKSGIDKLIDGQDDFINIYVYPCTVLPNSGLNEPSYKELHGIKSAHLPLLLSHSTPSEDSIVEFQDIVVETSSMKNDDWARTFIFYWAVQCFHCLGLLQQIAILFNKKFGLPYSDFYENLINHFSGDNQSEIGKQVSLISEIVSKFKNGGRMDVVLPEFGEIYWPLEEASFLKLITNKKKFYKEVRFFLNDLSSKFGLKAENELLDDLVLYQSSIMCDPFMNESKIKIKYNWYEFFKNLHSKKVNVKKVPAKIIIKADKNFAGNLVEYAREIVWYGRKGGKFHHSQITVELI